MKAVTQFHGRCFAILLLAIGLAQGQVLDHVRALGGARYPVGDPNVTVTNDFGARVDGPKDIAVGDLDADGHLDFAVANKDGSVTVYFGNGDGTFSAPSHLRTWTNAPLDAATHTITNFVTNSCAYVYTNQWSDNGTNMTNWAWVCQPGPISIVTNVIALGDSPTGLRGLALGNFVGAGRLDIAVASPGESLIYLLANLGHRQFAPARTLPAWLGVRDLVAGDFDGDGLADLGAAGTTTRLAHYRSLGGGRFQMMTNIASVDMPVVTGDFPQPAYYLKAFRVPGATRDEVVSGRAGRGSVNVFRANAAGRLEAQPDLAGTFAHALDVGPLLNPIGGGLPDLALVNHNDDTLEIHRGVASDLRFESNAVINLGVPGRAHGIAIGDFDHDGWNDIVVVLQRFARVQVIRNNHGHFEPTSELSAGAGPRELAVGDFNGDGRVDAVILNRDSEDVSYLQSSSDGFGFGSLDMLYPSDGEVVALQVYDFNGDGRDDVVELHRAAGEFSVRLSRADGTLSEAVFYSLGSAPSDTRAVDVNNDGIRDMLSVDLGGFVSVRLGRGNGTFGPEVRTTLQGYQEGGWSSGRLFSLTTADFDGDGNLDLAAGYMDCRLGLFRGHGDGTFEHTHTHLLGYETHGMATGDFDQDGKIDLVAAPWDGSLIVVRNHGDLLDTTNLDRTVINTSRANGGAWTVLLTDYNHDGDPDVLVDGGDGYSLYLGGPGASFTWSAIIAKAPSTNTVGNVVAPGVVNRVVSPVIGDFNGDGWSDIVGACGADFCISVSLGTADGTWGDPFLIRVPAGKLIATGDLDGDGKPDLIGTGEVLWTALSSRGPRLAPPPPLRVDRAVPAKPMINEILASNQTLPLAVDGGRTTDFVEIYNGGGAPLALKDWTLRLEQAITSTFVVTNSLAGTTNLTVHRTNDYFFPSNAIVDVGGHLVLVCSDKVRTAFHTGFNLPAEGGTLCLIAPDRVEADRVTYPPQNADRSYARFQDGVNGFVITDSPTPGAANADTGLNPPQVTFDGVDLSTLHAYQPIRFFARAKDDLGVVNVSVFWRRLDIPDGVTKRFVLYDDGFNGDGAFQDGNFAGLLQPGLPPGASIQFYLECTDLSGQTDTAPGNPSFVRVGEVPSVYTVSVHDEAPVLEISEILASNRSGLRDDVGLLPDWIEIRNCSGTAVSLNGVSLGHELFGSSAKLEFTNGMSLAAGQHLVVYADNATGRGLLHAPFKLNQGGDALVLSGQLPNGARYPMDAVVYGPQTADVSLARIGCGGPWVPSVPTPFQANVAGSWRGVMQSNTFLFVYPTELGKSYVVEFKDDLSPSRWLTLPAAGGSGLEQVVEQPIASKRFFRVRAQ